MFTLRFVKVLLNIYCIVLHKTRTLGPVFFILLKLNSWICLHGVLD